MVTQDLADPAHAADWIPKAEEALGPIDVLVSNAGLLTLGAVATFDPEEGERMMAINLLSPARLFRTVLPGMLARKRGVIWVTRPRPRRKYCIPPSVTGPPVGVSYT